MEDRVLFIGLILCIFVGAGIGYYSCLTGCMQIHKLNNQIGILEAELNNTQQKYKILLNESIYWNKSEATSQISFNISNIHGISLSFGQALRLNEEDFNRFEWWDLNTILIEIWWSEKIEVYQNLPGEYDKDNLIGLKNAIEKIEEKGFKVFLSGRVCHEIGDDSTTRWAGWSNELGAKYVNINIQDSSGSRGRERYGDWLAYMAERFPSCGISLWHFPYHMQGASDSERETLHEVTLPYLYNRVRNVSDQPIIVIPYHQAGTGTWSDGLETGFYDNAESYGWPFTDDLKLIYGFSNHKKEDNYNTLSRTEGDSEFKTWDYNYERLDAHYKPISEFLNRHPEAHFCDIESIGLKIHGSGSIRPIEKSRLDLAEAHFVKMEELGLGWLYWIYENPPRINSPIETNGSDSELVKLIEKYSHSQS